MNDLFYSLAAMDRLAEEEMMRCGHIPDWYTRSVNAICGTNYKTHSEIQKEKLKKEIIEELKKEGE